MVTDPTPTPATADSLTARAGRLFAAYQAGDEATMADLVALVTPLLWHTVRATRLDGATTEDVLQTVWLTLVRKAETIADPVAVVQWLVVTARREAWRVSRAQGRVQPEDMETQQAGHPDPRANVEAAVLDDLRQRCLWRHVETLSDRCRQLLRVIAFADRPDYASLAQALGMPQGSIGPTRGRCLAKLRLSLAADPSWEMT